MNPTYETDESRAKEAEFASAIEGRFSCKFHKLPRDWQLDGILSREGFGVALAELKCRKHQSTKFDTLVISAHKIHTGLKMSRMIGNCIDKKNLPLILFVRFTDKDVYVKIDSTSRYSKELLEARNHEQGVDREWVFYIPIQEFRNF